MKIQFLPNRRPCAWIAPAISLAFALASLHAADPLIQGGLTLHNINNPIVPIVTTNADTSFTIVGGGGDTYGAPDSFTYAYQAVSGDFDVQLQVLNVDATDVFGQDTPKGALMFRSSLEPGAYNVQISATPHSPSHRNGQIESIGRIDSTVDTDDLPGRLQNYTGDTTADDYSTYPDVWLRIQRQGEKVTTFFKTADATDFPSGSGPGSTNGWQILAVTKTGGNFPTNAFVGISTVAHNGDITDTDHTVTATYAHYGNTPSPASIPTSGGVPVPANQAPGPFPNTRVLAAHFDASVPADGLGYPGDVVQSEQVAATPIIWNSGGFASVSRDVIADIPAQSPGGFSFARYQAGAFDFLIGPRDPVASKENLGPYSNQKRRRFAGGDPTVPASQAYAPSPNLGMVFSVVHKNGAQWNDGSPAFYASTYVQLDGSATGQGYDMIGGHFRGAQFYTRTTKLVTGSPVDAASDLGNLQRCAIPISVFWFPYDQGWKAGFIDAPDATDATLSHWKRGDGWGLNSGGAVAGLAASNHPDYNSPKDLVVWTQPGLASLKFPGVNANTDGMLFTIGNDENNSTRGPIVNNAAQADGSWNIAVRDGEHGKADPSVYATGDDSGLSFSFLYVPYDAANLVGSHVLRDGTISKKAGNLAVTRLASGRYSVKVTGKADADGALMLQTSGALAGNTALVDTSVLSYQYDAGSSAFIVESRYVDASGGGEGAVKLRDAEFNVVFVDFLNPPSPTPAVALPSITITRTGNQVTLSWTGTYTLQGSPSIGPDANWVNLGFANPTGPLTIGSQNQFFRLLVTR